MDANQVQEQLERLLAKEQITDALLGYARGVDRLDLEQIRQTFHPDAVADYGAMFQGTGAEFADFIGQVHPPMETHTHHLSNISIQVDGDRAGSECYVIVRTRTVAEDGTKRDTSAYGRYIDRWERRDGTWRIAHRRYLHSLDETWSAETHLFPVAGSRDESDPSFEVLTAAPPAEERR
jgi:ketosteroid isomerase-like protein